MPRVDAYLSRKAQSIWPTALVLCHENTPEEGEQRWEIDRGVSPEGFSHGRLCLGASFQEAKAALDVTIAAEKARRHRA